MSGFQHFTFAVQGVPPIVRGHHAHRNFVWANGFGTVRAQAKPVEVHSKGTLLSDLNNAPNFSDKLQGRVAGNSALELWNVNIIGKSFDIGEAVLHRMEAGINFVKPAR